MKINRKNGLRVCEKNINPNQRKKSEVHRENPKKKELKTLLRKPKSGSRKEIMNLIRLDENGILHWPKQQ